MAQPESLNDCLEEEGVLFKDKINKIHKIIKDLKKFKVKKTKKIINAQNHLKRPKK